MAVGDVGHGQHVGAHAVAAGIHEIGSRGCGREERPAVEVHAAVLVLGAAVQHAARIADPVKPGVAQRAVAGRCPLEVEPVDLARGQGDLEPVAVAGLLDPARRRAVDRDRGGGPGRGRVVVGLARGHVGHGQRVGALPVHVALTGRRDVVDSGRVRRELQRVAPAVAAGVVIAEEQERAARTVDPVHPSEAQSALPDAGSRRVEVVVPARLQGDAEPVAVPLELHRTRGRAADCDRAGRAGVGRVVVGAAVGDVEHLQRVGALAVAARHVVVVPSRGDREVHPAVPSGAAVVVAGVGHSAAAGVADSRRVRVQQRAVPGP